MVLNQTYDFLRDKLKTIAIIKNIEWYLDQDKKKAGIVATPSVFIAFKINEIKDLSKGVRYIDLDFELKIFTDYKKSYHEITQNNKHFNVESEIIDLFKACELVGHTPLQKQSALLYSSYTFELKRTEFVAKKDTQQINAQNLSPKINTTLEVSD